MKKLNKHILNFELAQRYVKDTLIDVNVLSEELLNALDFKNGHFFTLLPEDANLENLYKFTAYGILPQTPEIEYLVNEQKASYSEIPTVDEEVADFILKTVQSNAKFSCIFDDFEATTTEILELSNLNSNNFYSHSFFYEKEVYYLIENKTLSQELIEKGLMVSNTFWHSLCILTEVSLKNLKNKCLSLEKIREVCEKTKMIMVGAYDREGFVFWEERQE
jgi:hypothetical protein